MHIIHSRYARVQRSALSGSRQDRRVGHIIDLTTNCYRYYVLRKALDCKGDNICLLTVSELVRGDPATTPANKQASHVWSKVKVVFILSNLYPSSSAPSFALVLSFDPLSLFLPRLLFLRYMKCLKAIAGAWQNLSGLRPL
ncbi:hypothetical protein C8J57DRAFT_1527275 [Mycena rebaudengoi]|nr:hypothetical protein C8J57DRAFT_1527275 [Mycena rebaudengoi]